MTKLYLTRNDIYPAAVKVSGISCGQLAGHVMNLPTVIRTYDSARINVYDAVNDPDAIEEGIFMKKGLVG